MEREPWDWISAWTFCAKSFIVTGPCQFIFMWFIRCHVVVHFNFLALSLLLRGLQSWRCQRTRKGKQIHELAPLSLFHCVLYAEPYKCVSPGFSGLWVHMGGVWASRAQGGGRHVPGSGAGCSSLPQAMAAAPWLSTRTLPGAQCCKPSCKFDYTAHSH